MKSLVGKFAPYILSVFIAILSFFSGATTDVGNAVAIAIDKDKAIIQANEILKNSTPQEILKATETTEK